jgi:enoyl-CoA hydratase/carnithine racemase
MAQSAEPASNEAVLLRGDEGHVATLTLNRPGKLNALSDELLAALERELERTAGDDGVRVVIIQGAGRGFSAGHDLAELRRAQGREARAIFERCARVMLAVARGPKPVIAKVHGIAAAAGCQLVAACDLAVASEDARFATSGINVGLFCSTPMVEVARSLPRKRALEMLLTGDFIDAPTALAHGLVNRVVPRDELDAAAGELAARVAGKSPAAVAFGKSLFNRQFQSTLDAAYEDAVETIVCNLMAEDAKAGIDAFVEKRPMPKWKGK